MALIEVNNLEKIYAGSGVHTKALAGASFKIEKGEFVSIMGPSGSGKSTLLHILGFLDVPTSGSYIFNGKEMHSYSDEELAKVRNEQFGFVFQDFNLLRRTTVFENVKLPLIYAGLKEKERDNMAKKIIEEVGLSDRIYHEPSQLSGGQKQRVAIARAFVNDPKVIFADEPTGNLDSKSGEQIMDILQRFHGRGHTIILITHETYTAEYAERIIRVKDGLIESDKKVSQRRNAFVK